MANEPKPHPEKTGVWEGPNPRPAGEGVPLTTGVPSAETTSAPGPGHITDEDAQKDQAARTGQGGLGSTATAAGQGQSGAAPGEANTPGGRGRGSNG